MEERRPRERELVLAPNEYAYVLDTTKGHINCYVGPNKTSLAQTDQPVFFDPHTKRFEHAQELQGAIQLFATAPANWYMVLKNPARDNQHPNPGVASNLVELQVGRKVNVPGPASFALWPGQMAKVIEGHRLRTNQYLLVQIYDAEEAAKQWRKVLGTSSEDTPEPRFVIGEKRIIRGSEVSFYVPPTGVEVVPDAAGNHVREAVTLQRLEYCVLVGEDGRKTYVRGEAVVFPEPSQHFLTRNGETRFKAMELSEITGLYVKVTAPYIDEDGVAHQEGEELFITGRNRIYFPREEHAIIRYGDHELHHAIAIPAGEGRYVLDRLTGEVALRRGPMMLLPDPRREVITRRVLADREVRLLYPGNEEALAANRSLRRGEVTPPRPAPVEPRHAPRAETKADTASFSRTTAAPAHRTITLDNKYEGAVSVDVWSGHAVQVVSRTGERRVVRGPSTVLLEFNESLEALSLSTGTPKNHDCLLSTAYLQVNGNQVSDAVEVISADLVRARVALKYRVNFEGDPAAWFAVDNYVRLLCDHASSLIKSAVRKVPIRALREEVTGIIRDVILGKRPESGARTGLAFSENGMRVYDVEVLDLQVTDPVVQEMLGSAQLAAIKSAICVAEKETALQNLRRTEEIDRALAQEGHATRVLALSLTSELEARAHAVEAEREQRKVALVRQQRDAEIADAQAADRLAQQVLQTQLAEHEALMRRKGDQQALELQLLQARVDGAVRQAQAYSPELVAALNRLTDAQLLSALAGNFGELAAVEGKGLLETAKKFLDFVPGTHLPQLRGSNGATQKT